MLTLWEIWVWERPIPFISSKNIQRGPALPDNALDLRDVPPLALALRARTRGRQTMSVRLVLNIGLRKIDLHNVSRKHTEHAQRMLE